MQLGTRTRISFSKSAWERRQRSIARARLSFNAALPRPGGRVATQIRRCLVAHDGIVSMTQLRSFAYVGQPRQHWHYKWIYAALRRLNAKRTVICNRRYPHTRKA